MNSESLERVELHHRRIEMRGWRRIDGLFEIEGCVSDRKPEDFVPLLGGKVFPAHSLVHDMGVRITFNSDFLVVSVETFTNAAPYRQCPKGGESLQTLIGLRMTSGWGKEVRSRLAGAKSCTHLLELLMPMATVAHQSLSYVMRAKPMRLDASGRPAKINSCYAYADHGELVAETWPDHYRPRNSI